MGNSTPSGPTPKIEPIDAPRDLLVRGLSRLPDRWRGYEIYLSALLIFAASRVVVLVGLNFGKLLAPAPVTGQWNVGDAWYDRLLRWDSGWYASIVDHGYRFSDDPAVQSSTVFYPLYPLVALATKTLLGVDEYVALLIVANMAALVAIVLMTKIAMDEVGRDAALLAVGLFSFFPTSLFLSAGYAESLFLALAMLSFVFLARGEFVRSAIFAGVSLAVRATGVVMIPAILAEIVLRGPSSWRLMLPRLALCGLLASSGLLAYMAYLEFQFGRPWAFAEAQAAWHGASFLDRFVSAATLRALFNARPFGNAALFLVFLAVTIASFRDLRPALSLYGLGTLLLPYFTLGITPSIERYLLACLPAFIFGGVLCKGRPWLAIALIGLEGALLLLHTARFSQWYIEG